MRDRARLLERVLTRRLEARALMDAGQVVLRGRPQDDRALGTAGLDGDRDDDVDAEGEAAIISRRMRRNPSALVVAAPAGWALPAAARPLRGFVPRE